MLKKCTHPVSIMDGEEVLLHSRVPPPFYPLTSPGHTAWHTRRTQTRLSFLASAGCASFALYFLVVLVWYGTSSSAVPL